MKKHIFSLITIAIFSFAFASKASAQCDTIASLCAKHMTAKYISDGQSYRALLLDQEVAEFHVTLFGGSTYRFAGCSGLSDGNLVFSVFDQERNLLFTNSEHKNAPHWDFRLKSTVDVIIEAQLAGGNAASGCAVLLIGFKQ